MTPKAQTLHQAIRQIRSCFNQLRALGDDLHRDLGITASMRAVMESLAEDGEQTVPQIARRKAVSRQHIQVNMDALTKAALVTLHANPAHRRSPFFTLTERGQSAFKEMRRREKDVLESLAKEVRSDGLEQTVATLTKLKSALVQERDKGGNHDG